MTDDDPINLLLVDDREENLLVLRTLLEGHDVQLLMAHSGREALELLLKHRVALALLDVQMPEMDGFELAELMRGTNLTDRVPIIFVTAAIHEQRREFRGYDAGAVDFLFKPIEPKVLQNKVRVFVDLYRKQRELERTLRLNEELVAIVSHDLRNPLNTIAAANALLEGLEGNAIVDAARSRIKRSVRRTASIIDDLLDLSRARLGGGIPVNKHECDLEQLSLTAIEELRSAHPDANIRLSSAGRASGHWDRDRLEQVVSNLVSNAMTHGRRGAPITVKIDGTSNEVVKLEVHNEGSIPAAALPTIFDPFERGRDRNNPRAGLGLGLYIVNQVAIAHSGTVNVTSSEADGTSFTCVLPRD